MTFTREEQIQAIYDLKVGYTLGHADIAILKSMARQLLASMERKPAAYMIGGYYLMHAQDPKVDNYASAVPLYTAPPAPVVPETLPCPVMIEPGLRFGKGVRTQTMLDALQRRAEYSAELEAMTPEQRADHDGGMKEFAAMLQGAELPAYEIKRFGQFSVTPHPEEIDCLVTSIQMFHFERGTIPEKAYNQSIVEKYALQAIINALQHKCDGMDDAPIPVIWPAPRPEVN